MKKSNIKGDINRILKNVGEKAFNKQLAEAAKGIVENELRSVSHGQGSDIGLYNYLIKVTNSLVKNKKSVIVTELIDDSSIDKVNNLIKNLGAAKVNKSLKELKKEKLKNQMYGLFADLTAGANLQDMQEILKDFKNHHANGDFGDIKFNHVTCEIKREIMIDLLNNFTAEAIVEKITSIQNDKIKTQMARIMSEHEAYMQNNIPKCFKDFENQYKAIKRKKTKEK